MLFFLVYASSHFEIQPMGYGTDDEEGRRCNTGSSSHSGDWDSGLKRLREAAIGEKHPH
jgi:hypothetical protein